MLKGLKDFVTGNYSARLFKQMAEGVEKLEEQVEELQRRTGVAVAQAADEASETAAKVAGEVNKQAGKVKDAVKGGSAE